jgi:hypothetical protein
MYNVFDKLLGILMTSIIKILFQFLMYSRLFTECQTPILVDTLGKNVTQTPKD